MTCQLWLISIFWHSDHSYDTHMVNTCMYHMRSLLHFWGRVFLKFASILGSQAQYLSNSQNICTIDTIWSVWYIVTAIMNDYFGSRCCLDWLSQSLSIIFHSCPVVLAHLLHTLSPKISVHAYGGPRSRVCARATLPLPPPTIWAEIFWRTFL